MMLTIYQANMYTMIGVAKSIAALWHICLEPAQWQTIHALFSAPFQPLQMAIKAMRGLLQNSLRFCGVDLVRSEIVYISTKKGKILSDVPDPFSYNVLGYLFRNSTGRGLLRNSSRISGENRGRTEYNYVMTKSGNISTNVVDSFSYDIRAFEFRHGSIRKTSFNMDAMIDALLQPAESESKVDAGRSTNSFGSKFLECRSFEEIMRKYTFNVETKENGVVK